jgi:hypothetical protein
MEIENGNGDGICTVKTATNGSNDSKIHRIYSWAWPGGQMASSNEQRS